MHLTDIEKEMFLEQLEEDLIDVGIDEDTIVCILDEARDGASTIEIHGPANLH